MKKLNTTLSLLLMLFISGLTYAQTCNADATISLTGNPGEIEIIDNSTTSSGAAATYSWVDIYQTPGWSYEGTVYLQPNSSTGTYQFTENGTYNYYISVQDSITNCFDSISGSITITNIAVNCDASFSYYDTVNNQTYFYPNNYDANLEYSWDFGDGNYSNDPYPYHTYSAPGTYTACLIVWDNAGSSNCADTICQTITVNNTTSCDASFTYYDTINNQTYFYPNNYDANLYYSWDFGDGNYSNNPYPYHSYSSPGTYTACLTVWDNNGGITCADTVCETITVTNNNNCDASFSYLDTVNGQTYFLPNNYDSNLSYYWDFGDGNTSTDPYPSHIYNTPGTYTACLTVWEPLSGGTCADTVCESIVVTNNSINCNANFYLFQDSTNSSVYYIWDLSSGSNLSYSWDFGDGTVSNQQYPTHTYNSQGIFNICLTITDNVGNCTDQHCQTIEALNKAIGTTINIVPFGQTADLEEENIISDVKLFPNPTSSTIKISLRGNVGNDYNYQIIDIMGNQIELGDLNSNQNVASKEINVEQLQQGVYFVRIIESSNKEKVKTLKFIKK
jgi:PKD repeat protein